MMKRRQDRITPSGVRIPQYKVKWMSSPAEKKSKKHHKAKHKKPDVPNINLIYNLHVHAASLPGLPECKPIEVEKWEECDDSDV